MKNQCEVNMKSMISYQCEVNDFISMKNQCEVNVKSMISYQSFHINEKSSSHMACNAYYKKISEKDNKQKSNILHFLILYEAVDRM